MFIFQRIFELFAFIVFPISNDDVKLFIESCFIRELFFCYLFYSPKGMYEFFDSFNPLAPKLLIMLCLITLS